jgi:hypothetical protein
MIVHIKLGEYTSLLRLRMICNDIKKTKLLHCYYVDDISIDIFDVTNRDLLDMINDLLYANHIGKKNVTYLREPMEVAE